MRKIIVVVICMLGSFLTQAQQKIGYLSSGELLSVMPEVKKADTDIEAYAKTFKDQLMNMQKELETKAKDLEAKEKSMTDAIKEVKYKELQDLQVRMQGLQQTGEEKISKKKEELYKPITEKANKAIQDVAKEKGYTYIIDASSGSLLFASESENILTAVKTKLGIK